METCVIYARKSNESALATDVSFEDQEDACREYAQKRGYAVLKAYRESHSGADLAGRPLIWEAMDDIRHGDAQVLLVRNYDRLARKPEHQGVILYEVEEKGGGRVEAALEPMDRNDIMARTTRGILAVVAEAERLNAVARMERGKRRRAERGHRPGASNPLYGYLWLDDEPGKRTTFVEDPESAPVVRRIFGLASHGHSLRYIARLFNAEKVPTPSQMHAQNGHIGRRHVGDAGWSAQQVKRFLNDRTYTGHGSAYRTTWIRSATGRKPIIGMNPVPMTVPALVDEETFEAANKAIALRAITGRPPIDQETSWLRGHVYCGMCGERMYLKLGPSQKYIYGCRNRLSSATNPELACPGGDFNILSSLLDEPAYRELTRTVKHLEPLRELMLKRLGTDRVQALTEMAEGFESQLREKREDLDAARRRAVQTRDETLAFQFLRDAERLLEEVHTLEADYAEAREQLDTFNAGNAWVDTALERIRSALSMPEPTEEDIRALGIEERRLLLAASGLYLKVYPVSSGKRVETGWMWALGPKASLPSPTLLRLIIRAEDLLNEAEGLTRGVIWKEA